MTLQTLRALGAFIANPSSELSGADVMQFSGLLSGTLYPILIRLEEARWLTSRWENIDPSEVGRPKRRLYRLTGIGRKAYETERATIEGGVIA